MKKRWVTAILAGTLMLGVCGCEKQPTETMEPTPAVTQTVAPTPSPTATPTPTLKPLGKDGMLLMSFLRGEEKGAADEDFYDEIYHSDSGLVDMEPFTIRELFQRLTEMDERAGSLTYALMDTLGGREMLVLLYTPGVVMGPNLYLVFGVFDGQVRLTYATEFGYRSYTELYQGLVFSGAGSAGAGDHYYWDGYMDETGHYQALYQNGEVLSGWWAFDYTKIHDENLDGDYRYELYLLEMDATEYYELGQWTEEGWQVDPALLARMREYLDGKGMTEIDSVNDLIADAYVARGFPGKPEPYDGPWLPLELNQ